MRAEKKTVGRYCAVALDYFHAALGLWVALIVRVTAAELAAASTPSVADGREGWDGPEGREGQ